MKLTYTLYEFLLKHMPSSYHEGNPRRLEIKLLQLNINAWHIGWKTRLLNIRI